MDEVFGVTSHRRDSSDRIFTIDRQRTPSVAGMHEHYSFVEGGPDGLDACGCEDWG